MFDCYNRPINYLRISVTDRCNLRCRYCMPQEGIEHVDHHKVLSFDEIVAFTKYAVQRGIVKVRITGGEPLVRKGIVELIKNISEIDGISDFGMTSNGVLLPQYAQQLSKAGLHRINISLDTLNPERFREITRTGNISDVLKGIDAAVDAGLTPVKINCVIENNENEPDALSVAEFGYKKGLQVRFIPLMNLEKGEFGVVHGGNGGNCSICNRIRLTSTGDIKPCLFSNLAYNIRELGIKKAFDLAINNKPKSGIANDLNAFYNIGG